MNTFIPRHAGKSTRILKELGLTGGEADELPISKIHFGTYQEWYDLGYRVKKGSRAFWADGVPYFTKAQVSYFPNLEGSKLAESINEQFDAIMNQHLRDLKGDLPF